MNSFNTLDVLESGDGRYQIHRVNALTAELQLPFSIRILLENLLRHEDGVTVTRDDIQALLDWNPEQASDREIQFRPARVLMQDFTGVPAVVDLAAMRNAMYKLGGRRKKSIPCKLPIWSSTIRCRLIIMARPAPSAATPNWNFSATANATLS